MGKDREFLRNKTDMTDSRSKQKLAGLFVEVKDVDVSDASIDTGLAKVWSDEPSGELAVSVDRLLFDSLLDVATRYLEPNGFAQNLENLLAIIDSMRLGVFATTSAKNRSDGRAVAKKLMPALFMQLPRKREIGPILRRFYDEVARYESELSRLQLVESKARQALDSAIKDESGKKTLESLRRENDALKEELARISKKLAFAEDAIRSVPINGQDNLLPPGIRSCVVRAVRVQEGVVLLKSDDTQFTVPLKSLEGTPTLSARALGFHEGGVIKSVWIFDPKPEPFSSKLAVVVATDGRKIKIKFTDRIEQIVQVSAGEEIPNPGTAILAKYAGVHLISLVGVSSDASLRVADIIFDRQTKMQIEEQFSGEAS